MVFLPGDDVHRYGIERINKETADGSWLARDICFVRAKSSEQAMDKFEALGCFSPATVKLVYRAHRVN